MNMSVNVRIKQKSFLRKKVDLQEILKIIHLSYGVCDENYRLIKNQTAQHTLIYDETKLARGIDLSIECSDILLTLSLPTSKEEIRCFYDTIEKVCKHLKLKSYFREGEKVSIKNYERFIEADERGSISGLEDLQTRIDQKEYSHFEIFGVYHPISIGRKEIDEIGNSLDRFSDFLNRIQQEDVYYAAPKVYKIKDHLIGIYAIGANISSVVPTKPYIVLNQIQGIEDWYVMLKEGKAVKYEDFINNISESKYYDSNHLVVTLTEKEIDVLIQNYLVEL